MQLKNEFPKQEKFKDIYLQNNGIKWNKILSAEPGDSYNI